MKITENEQKHLKISLGILSGRIKFPLDSDVLSDLGYDTYKFGYYGQPDENDVKLDCENLIFKYLTEKE